MKLFKSMLLLVHYECKSLNLRVLHKPLMLQLGTARASLPVLLAQLPMLLSALRPFWSSPSTSVPSAPGTSPSFCAPSSLCYCQWGLAHLSQLFSSAPSQPQSTSAGWGSARFSSCIHGLACLGSYDWKKDLFMNLSFRFAVLEEILDKYDILVNKKGAIPQSNNTVTSEFLSNWAKILNLALC